MSSVQLSTFDETYVETLKQFPSSVVLVDQKGVIRLASDAAHKTFGYAPGELINLSVDTLMPKSARGYHQKVRDQYESHRSERAFTSGQTFECIRTNGEHFQADISLSPVEIKGQKFTWAEVADLDRPSPQNVGRKQAMTALDAIGRIVASSFDLSSNFASITEDLKEILPFDQMSVNLLNNASKYSPAETDIELSVENLGDSVKLSVSDRGPGLPEENVEGLFEMFHRADNEETRRIPGTGSVFTYPSA